MGDLKEMTVIMMAKYPRASLLLTGHSLGGSVAMIAAIRLKEKLPSRKTEIHTFGAPKSGNPAWASYLKSKMGSVFRVIHNRDPAPHYPFIMAWLWHPPY